MMKYYSLCSLAALLLGFSSHASDYAFDEMRIEVSDVSRALHTTRVDLQLLEEKVKSQEKLIAHLKAQLGDTSHQAGPLSQLAAQEKRIAQIEKFQEKIAADLRQMSTSSKDALLKLQGLEQEIAGHEKRLEEVVKLKGTLTSISKAIAPRTEAGSKSYKVKAGDSLEKIARLHHTTAAELKRLNALENDKIIVGQELKVPPHE